MTCASCRREISDRASFCPHCGSPATPATASSSEAETLVAPEASATPPAPQRPAPRLGPAIPTGPLDPDTAHARQRYERRRARRGLPADQEQFGLPLPDADRVKQMASQVKAAASSAASGASGAIASAPAGSFKEHVQMGYTRSKRYAGTGAGVIALSILLLLVLGGMTAAAVDEMGYGDLGEIVGVLGGSITFLVSSTFFFAGLNLRASASAQRAALDAAVLASDLSDDDKADLLPTG